MGEILKGPTYMIKLHLRYDTEKSKLGIEYIPKQCLEMIEKYKRNTSNINSWN